MEHSGHRIFDHGVVDGTFLTSIFDHGVVDGTFWTTVFERGVVAKLRDTVEKGLKSSDLELLFETGLITPYFK